MARRWQISSIPEIPIMHALGQRCTAIINPLFYRHKPEIFHVLHKQKVQILSFLHMLTHRSQLQQRKPDGGKNRN
jgi:hypothetical protein